MKKWLVMLAMVLCFALPLVNAQEAQAATVAKGSCGSNITWKLNSSGDLTISGSGKMKTYKVSNPGLGTFTTKYPWFEYASKIKTVTVKSGVTSISKGAFAGCYKVKKVTISKTVKTIGSRAFVGTNVKTFKVASGSKYFSSSGGVLFNKKKTKLIAYGNGLTKTSYTVPATVTRVCTYAFTGNWSVTKVTLKSKVNYVGVCAFDQTNITRVVCNGCKPTFADGDVPSNYEGITVKYK